MKILIIEDEQSLATYMQRGLRESSHAVDIVHTGQHALYTVRVSHYDVIILDVNLPDTNGFHLCRTLRDYGILTPICMLTARDTIHDRVEGLDSGADDYIIKPFAMDELHARVRALARRPPTTHKSNQLCVADVVVDTITRRVWRNHIAIELTSKEYAILECLMRAPDRVFTREVITEHVWSHDSFNHSNVIDVYIRNLRRKLDDPFTTKLIQTIRGTGYRLHVPTENSTDE